MSLDPSGQARQTVYIPAHITQACIVIVGTDVQLCGYESISQGHSAFCHLFTDEEWRDVEYYFDVRFHHMMGYANKLSPYLGMPWVKTAEHLLSGKDSDGSDPHAWEGEMEIEGKLPKPKLPPNATHTQ